MVLLLDTHVWLWSAAGDSRTGKRTKQLLARAQRAEQIRVTPVSVFEIASLCTHGRLRLAVPVDQWVLEALGTQGVRLAELTPAIAADAGSIPRGALADPFDRLIVSTARQLGATLLTADRRILNYARDTTNVLVQDAAR